MKRTAIAAIGVLLAASSYMSGTGCTSATDSSRPTAAAADPTVAAVIADSLRTYAIASQCALLAYLDAAPTAQERKALSRLADYGVTAATDPGQTISDRIKVLLHNASATPGFKAQVFYDEPGCRYIIAFAGTEPHAPDIITDIDGAFSTDEPQNATALRLTDSLTALLAGIAPDEPMPEILLTGHSLGGRLAGVASIMRGLDAVVFNPANLPIDLQRSIEEDKDLQRAADDHLVRIHTEADELTGGLRLAEQLSPYLPYVSAAMDRGTDWLDDRSSLSTLKSIISSAPEIAGAVGTVWEWISPSDSQTPTASAASLSRIIVELVAHMRDYGVTEADLQNPLFYRQRGRAVALPYLRGGHSMAPISQAIDSAYTNK